MIFCDTSFVAKIYVREPESASVERLLESEDTIYLSGLAYPELMATFHRRLREKKWSAEKFDLTVSQFRRDEGAGFLTWLPLESEIMESAAQAFTHLPPTVFLRAADCLHLITAQRHGFTEIHTFDAHQAVAARVLGLKPIKV